MAQVLDFTEYTDESADENAREELILEYRRLLACYQIASRQDKEVVWAVLNRYAAKIDLK